MNRFIVTDSGKCIGCHTCEVACVVAHEPSESVALLTPKRFAPRLHLVQTFTVSEPVTCHQCDDAPCLNACPSGAIFYGTDTVQIDQASCLGCKTCVIACPFGAMDVIALPTHRSFAGVDIVSGVKAEAHKCDLCIGRAAGPACVEMCPTDALYVMDDAMMADMRQQRQQRSALSGSLSSPVR